MLIKAKALKGFSLKSLDGNRIGQRVLLRTTGFGQFDLHRKKETGYRRCSAIAILPERRQYTEEAGVRSIDQEQIEESPAIDTTSRCPQFEDLPIYMAIRLLGVSIGGEAIRTLFEIAPDGVGPPRNQWMGPPSSQHSRSAGYHLNALDG